LVLGYLLGRLALLVLLFPLLEALCGLAPQIMVHHVGRGDAVDLFRQHTKVLIGPNGRAKQNEHARNCRDGCFMSIHICLL